MDYKSAPWSLTDSLLLVDFMVAYVAKLYALNHIADLLLILQIQRMTRDLITYENWFVIQNRPPPYAAAAFSINRRGLAGSFARAVAVPRFPSPE